MNSNHYDANHANIISIVSMLISLTIEHKLNVEGFPENAKYRIRKRKRTS